MNTNLDLLYEELQKDKLSHNDTKVWIKLKEIRNIEAKNHMNIIQYFMHEKDENNNYIHKQMIFPKTYRELLLIGLIIPLLLSIFVGKPLLSNTKNPNTKKYSFLFLIFLILIAMAQGVKYNIYINN